MLTFQPTAAVSANLTRAMGLGGVFDDLTLKIGNGLKAGAAILKDLTTIRTTSTVEVKVDVADAVSRAILPTLAGVVAVSGAYFLTKRFLNPACRVI